MTQLGESSSSLTPLVHSAIRKRLVFDLEVVGSIPISNIGSQLLPPTEFISLQHLRRIFEKYSDFEICSYSSGEEFCFLASKITRGISRSSAASGSCRTYSKRLTTEVNNTRKLRKAYVYLETTHPDLIGALTTSVSWKLFEKLNLFFRERYTHADCTFIDWLMGLVKYKCKKSLTEYEQALLNCLVQRAASCVKTWPCSLQQVADAVCRGYVRLVSVDFVLGAFRRASHTFDVVFTRPRYGEPTLVVVKLPSTQSDRMKTAVIVGGDLFIAECVEQNSVSETFAEERRRLPSSEHDEELVSNSEGIALLKKLPNNCIDVSQ